MPPESASYARVCARRALTLFGMNAGRDQKAVVGLVEIYHREVGPTGKARVLALKAQAAEDGVAANTALSQNVRQLGSTRLNEPCVRSQTVEFPPPVRTPLRCGQSEMECRTLAEVDELQPARRSLVTNHDCRTNLSFELRLVRDPNFLGFLQVHPHENRVDRQKKKSEPTDERRAVHDYEL